MKAVISYRMNF